MIKYIFDMEGKYYSQIKPILKIYPDLASFFNPPSLCMDEAEFQESKALELVYITTAIAYLGILDGLNLEMKLEKAIETIKLPKKNTKHRKKMMTELIEVRKIAIQGLFPKDQIPESIKSELSILGLVGLGLLRMIAPDDFRNGMVRLGIVGLLLQEDPFAALIRERYPSQFDGAITLADLLRDKNFIGLPPKEIKRLLNR